MRIAVGTSKVMRNRLRMATVRPGGVLWAYAMLSQWNKRSSDFLEVMNIYLYLILPFFARPGNLKPLRRRPRTGARSGELSGAMQ
jgi:hypothetical protein